MILILLSLFISASFTQNVEDKFKEATQLYENEKFEEAVIIYEELANNNINSYELYYNLGNTYYRLNQVGLSIYNYNKALKLKPNDEDALFNLELAKLKTIDKFDEIPTFFLDDLNNTISHLFNEQTWTIISIILGLISLFLISVFFTTYDAFYKKISIISFITTIILFIVTSYFGFKQSQYQHTNTNGVIVTSSAYIKSAPDEKSTDILILHEGTGFELLDKSQDWRKIRLTDGNVGWINSESILVY